MLVDTSPDVRAQLLAAQAETVDAVIWSHEHADQVHGIDDLRPYTFRRGAIEAWADAPDARRSCSSRFGYVFETAARASTTRSTTSRRSKAPSPRPARSP